jgi:hypothetical protein
MHFLRNHNFDITINILFSKSTEPFERKLDTILSGWGGDGVSHTILSSETTNLIEIKTILLKIICNMASIYMYTI